MSQPNGGRRYRVTCPDAIVQTILELQRRASRSGRGEAVNLAFRRIVEQLESDPNNSGEPRYRLPALRLEVRCIVLRPVSVDFAVHQDEPVVFIRRFQLLSL